jgi:hypothetical protein
LRKYAKGYKNISLNEWFISEQSNQMPNTLIVEALAINNNKSWYLSKRKYFGNAKTIRV